MCMYNYLIANKRKTAMTLESQTKRFKPDVNIKPNETLDSMKESEYQTNIAICEVQLEELRYADVLVTYHILLI